mgnify:CR=1 FL=1
MCLNTAHQFSYSESQEILGEGNYSQVFAATLRSTREKYAFKIVDKSAGLVAPDPWDDITSADKDCDHVDFMGTYTIE